MWMETESCKAPVEEASMAKEFSDEGVADFEDLSVEDN
jgi:hypothetical protein